MPVCYVFALSCEVRHSIEKELFDTFQYMTRSEDYNFGPPEHPLFTDESTREVTLSNGEKPLLLSAWRHLITNRSRGGEEDSLGKFYSAFQDYRIEFRRLVRDDDLFDVWYSFGPLIASVSKQNGFVGYYLGDTLYPKPKLTLIYFEDGLVFECFVKLSLESESSPHVISEESQKLSADLDAFPEQIIQEFDFQAREYNLSIERYIESASFYKELVIPQEIQKQWAWKYQN